MNGLTIPVSQLNQYIKNIFDAEEMLIGINVVGEVTNFKESGRAIYFDLKDESASIPCVVFDSSIVGDFKFGDKVTVKGKLNFYTKGGRLTFVVSKMEKFGVGDLYKEFIELKEKLEKEGLFNPENKKELPKYPQRIGVVTSRTGAVIRDIIRVARSKNVSTDIVLFPAKVQGIGAKEEIIKGIKVLDERNLDVIIVARGGGSFEDYQPFNTEEVCRVVYNAKTPIISAIGHETDWSLIDFVADCRAGTPSIASEMAFFDEKNEHNKKLLLLNSSYMLIKNKYLKTSDKMMGQVGLIERILFGKLDKIKDRIDKAKNLLEPLSKNKLEKYKSKIDVVLTALDNSNPIKLLSRGYTRVTAESGKTITSIEDVNSGDKVNFRLKDGLLKATILEKGANANE